MTLYSLTSHVLLQQYWPAWWGGGLILCHHMDNENPGRGILYRLAPNWTLIHAADRSAIRPAAVKILPDSPH